jgi:riboflavin kinase / FMN adenylyltransferase
VENKLKLFELNREQVGSIISSNGVKPLFSGSSSLTVGNFDGLHQGHRALIDATIDAKNRIGLDQSVVFTFNKHPKSVLKGQSPSILTSYNERIELFRDSEIDIVVSVEFCDDFASLDYAVFVELFLSKLCGMVHMIGGYDVHVGSERTGTASKLSSLGEAQQFTFESISALKNEDGSVVSSSAIRALLIDGNVEKVIPMFGRPYKTVGHVGYGDGRGASLGYPTANITLVDELKLVPAPGVYAVKLLLTENGVPRKINGMLNYGLVPTIHKGGLQEPRIEVNLFDYSESLREKTVEIEWFCRIRDEHCFASVEDLKLQLADDENVIRKFFIELK